MIVLSIKEKNVLEAVKQDNVESFTKKQQSQK